LFAFVLHSELPVIAYIDPGSGSMMLQLLLASIAGAGVLLKYSGAQVWGYIWPFGKANRSSPETASSVAPSAEDPPDSRDETA
jgi:hypothetical protein